jgi:hypothetical protein
MTARRVSPICLLGLICAGLAAGAARTGADPAPAPTPIVKRTNPFAEMPRDDPAYDAVRALDTAGIFTGYPDGTFNGKRPLTRYEFAVATERMVAGVKRAMERLDGSTPFFTFTAAPLANAAPGRRGETIFPSPRLLATFQDRANLTTSLKQLQALVVQFGPEIELLAPVGGPEQLRRDVGKWLDNTAHYSDLAAKVKLPTQ